MDDPRPSPDRPARLRRALTFWPLLLYGLGVIVGAGIYVAIGTVIGQAGRAAPLSFLLAGAAAGLTGLCYAELAGRFPQAGGGVVFVQQGFGSQPLARLTGAVTAAAIVIAAASIAHGAVQYLRILLALPEPALVVLLVAVFTSVAVMGVRESVGLAAAMAVVELGGLLAATTAGLLAVPAWHPADLVAVGWLPVTVAGWSGVLTGAFTAFFAFTGFETLANLAEEVRDAPRTLPRGILAAVAASTCLYVAVSLAAVLGGGGTDTPLLALFSGRAAAAFAIIGSIAVANGVLVHLVLLARLLYGMAWNGHLPAILARVGRRTQTPVAATLLGGMLVLGVALAVPFAQMLATVNLLTLSIFVLVDLALWRIHRADTACAGGAGGSGQFRAPGWVPPAAAAVSLALMLAGLLAGRPA